QATQASRLRWLIIALVFFATIINFLDRLTISVLAVPICQSLHLNNLQFASISTWFLLAYTISQGISGRVFDRIGTKLGFTISVVIWSTAAMAHSVARGLASLSIFRALLGLGEAGNWPGATKVIAEWFPVRERALAMGIFNSGPSLGSVIAPPLIVWLNLRYGWQAAFLVTGSLGFLWLFAWLLIYRPAPVAVEEAPPSSSEMPPQPLAASRKILEYESPLAIDDDAAWTWRELLLHRQVWAIICCRVLVDPVWWLYILWLPKYLGAARGLSLQQAGWRTSIPFIAADIGALTGGFASGYLIQRRWSVDASRKTIVILATVPMMAGFFAPHASSLVMALAYISCVTFGFQAWINNVQTLPTDLFPERAVATVAGLGGVGAGIGSMIFTLSTGWVVDHFSYTPVLMTAGLLPAAGTAVLLALLGRVEPVHRRA
ncbi:MAG TPA: MFS transporter, partial [Tepidisphaeraceae bacterium]|nr:MFS transporter [Tepidisphaeraceae bacterium]